MDTELQKGKILLRHLLDVYTGKREPGGQNFVDMLFDLFIPKHEFSMVENINDFVNLIANNFIRIIDLDRKAGARFEIMFIERVEETKSLLVHAKDKCSLDLEGKHLLIFLLQQPVSYRKEQSDI